MQMDRIAKLFVFEGPDGTGKTTLSRRFAEALRARGLQSLWTSFPGREEGTLGKLVYDLHHDPAQHAIESIDPTSLQLLHVAAHFDSIGRTILPALRRGETVVMDRFWWSTWVYGATAGADLDVLGRMIELERARWGDVKPDVIFLLQTPEPYGEVADDDWKRLAVEYERLAENQQESLRVVRVRNEGDVNRVVHELLKVCSDDAGPDEPAGSPAPPAEPGVAPLAHTKLAPLRPTAVYETYWRFAAERQAVFFRRLRGQRLPWTVDPILQEFKFTNAYRASDRVSQYLIRNVIYSGSQEADEVFFRTILFKVFNRIETWELLRRELDEIAHRSFDFDRYDRVLSRAIDSGERIYSAAYIMPSGGAGNSFGRKHRMHLKLIDTMMREELPSRIAESSSMGKAFELLRSYPTIGDFLAYQYVTDLNYSNLTQFSEMQFVVPGPGARDGIRKCFSDLGGLTEPEVIRLIADRQQAEFDRLGLSFEDLWGRPLQLIDCQNLFCEVDKYARVKHPEIAGRTGRTRIKQRYKECKASLRYWYPPKWGLNDRVAKETRHVSELLWSDG
jgi:thymidylate kinase